MRVAVTGASGFVGSHLVPELVNAGHEVVAISRHAKRPKNAPPNLEYAAADVADRAGLTQALAGCEAVVNLVAIIVERKGQSFTKVNVEGAANVAAAAKAAGAGHLLHLSAVGARPDPSFRYLFSKWEGEEAVRRSGVPFSIIRSSLIFGTGDGFFTLLARLIRRTPFFAPIAGSGDALFQPIAVEDVVRCMLIALASGPGNDVKEVGGPEQLSYAEIVKTVTNAIGARRIPVHVPLPVMTPGAWLMEKLLSHPPVTVDQLHSLQVANIAAANAVQHEFGFQPQSLTANAGYLQLY